MTSDHSGFTPTEREDHRSVVARKKREQMRARILAAMMDLLSDRANVSTSIEDVVNAAGVSRGTFYKHFTSLDEAFVAVGREVTDQMTLGILPIYDVLTDPVQRVSTGMRLFLTRALSDRRWAGFVLRAELVPHESVLLDYLMNDLRAGAYEGAMDFEDLQAAADSVMGATTEGIRTVLLGRTREPRQYIDNAIRITLRGLGVDKARALEATAFSRSYLMAHASGAVDHWATVP
ncbi:TetR/AcrR family transcriptional regulator [Cupriavidus sp. 30B13]|uniref:TetR/AcrR family transcriptional regulator n=1 Tax=Cupriavidus sp. 30B13 TaxID=3384241 RepID=UPI003B8F62DE